MTTRFENDGMRFTPRMFLDYHVRRLGIEIEEIGIAPTVIMTWFNHVREYVARGIDGRGLPHAPSRHAMSGLVQGVPVTIVQCPIGAPGTISHMEELIACGAKRFIGIGAAGSLQPENAIGGLLVPDHCVSDEGTSRHYVTPDTVIHAHQGLLDTLIRRAQTKGYPFASGGHWTTDAVYRERVETIERHRQAGILGVDMETSAMYALGLVRGVEVANVLAVSDELWHEWNPAFGTDHLRAALERACEVALSAVSAYA